MTDYKSVNGILIELNAEELAIRKAEVDAWNSKLVERKLKRIKEMRLKRLQETDWYSNSDVVMPNSIKTWRQSLRDLPQNHTTEAEYDTLLEMEGISPNRTYKHSIWSKP